MYLSRLILDPHSREVRRDIGNCHGLHVTIMHAFPKACGESAARAAFEILHRLESSPTSGRITLYVHSSEKPNWSALPRGYLIETGIAMENPACKSVDEQYGALTEGRVLSFRLLANPTKRVGSSSKPERLAGNKRSGDRVPICGEDALVEWLRRKGADGGFELVSVRAREDVPDALAIPRGHLTGIRLKNIVSGEKEKLTFCGVLFEGHLRITDREVFLKTLKRGVGSGKAYGFGLLSLAPQ